MVGCRCYGWFGFMLIVNMFGYVGKIIILYKMKMGELVIMILIIGFNVELIKY